MPLLCGSQQRCWVIPLYADALSVDERQVRRWTTVAAMVPEQVAAWLERRAAAMAADPPPVREAALQDGA